MLAWNSIQKLPGKVMMFAKIRHVTIAMHKKRSFLLKISSVNVVTFGHIY